MKRSLLAVSLFLLTFLSCKLSQFNPFKRVIDYPEPEMTVNNTYFSDLGCYSSLDCLPQELKSLDPPITSIYQPPNLLGGLTPDLPLAVATSVQFGDIVEVPAVYTERCMGQFAVRYLVYVEDEIRLVDSVEGMAELFAPIDNEDEALSYAMAVTGLSAFYDLDNQWTYKRLVNSLEETYSKYDGEKYTVHLFNTFLCGCGPHITTSVDVTVNLDGTISLGDPVEAFSDPATDDLCID